MHEEPLPHEQPPFDDVLARLEAFAERMGDRLARDEAMSALLEAAATCFPSLTRSAVFSSADGNLIAATQDFDTTLLPQGDADLHSIEQMEDQLILHSLGADQPESGYWAIELTGSLPAEPVRDAVLAFLHRLFGSERPDAARLERLRRGQVERLERDQALMQSLLAQIDTLIMAEDVEDTLAVVCTQLVETGLFLGAWVADSRGDLSPLASGGDSELIDHPSPEACRALMEGFRRAEALVEANHSLVFDEHIAAPFASQSWFDTPPMAALIPLSRHDRLWAFLVVVAAREEDLDQQVTDVLVHLSDLVNRSLEQLDLRERLDEEQRRNTYLAYHDPLTNLANRRAVDDELPKAMRRADRHQQMLAIVLLDLDDFKPINDRYGHAAGDEMLMTLAKRLKSATRDTDTAARLGGDEFLLVLEDIGDDAGLTRVLNRLSRTIRKPILLEDGLELHANGSIGVTRYPVDNGNPEQLIRNADAALYSAKNNKVQRAQDWVIWQEGTLTDGPECHDDSGELAPYGPQAKALLEPIQPEIEALTDEFIERFHQELTQHESVRRIIKHLSSEEYQTLKREQADHLHFLLAPGLEQEAHANHARHIGYISALAGVSPSDLVRAITVYMHEFNQTFNRAHLNQRHQNRLERVFIERLSRELSNQLDAGQSVGDEYQRTLTVIDERRRREHNWPDFNENLLDTLMGLPGITGVSILSPDGDGRFVANYSEGLDPFAVPAGNDTHPTLDLNRPEADHPVSRAYRFAQLDQIENYAVGERWQPWRAQAVAADILTTAAIPILGTRDQPIAVICLHGHIAGMFDNPLTSGFCVQLMALVSQAWRQIRNPAALLYAKGDYDRWRQAFYDGGLEMIFQPVIDVQTGQLTTLEALARLFLPDGDMIMPNMFIPWLNDSQVMRLFEVGLEQSLQCLRDCEAHNGRQLSVAINLPVNVLIDPATPGHIRAALDRHGISPHRVTLELLEQGDTGFEPGELAKPMQRIGAIGVKLAMDDLGSGYNNLLRLRSLPFSTVKIDQGMVRAAQNDPGRVLTFIASMIQMAHALELQTVVEGLETRDLIEATSLLGGQLGQGYAIARPLRNHDLLAWMARFDFGIDPARPTTPLGAMAALWGLRALGRDHLEHSTRHHQLRVAASHWATEHLDTQRALATDILSMFQQFREGSLAHDAFDRRLNELMQALDRLIRDEAGLEAPVSGALDA